MEYNVKIAGLDIDVKDGFVIKEEMNETLDSGTIQFVGKMREYNLEQFDTVSIEANGISRKKQLVDIFTTETVEFDDISLPDSLLEFTVNIFSETKYLERITCPNLTITKNVTSPATVYKKVIQYLQMYLPRINIYDPLATVAKKCCYVLDPTLKTKLNMECPEMAWNAPTLREVLTDLFAVGKLIPIVKDNVLTYIDLDLRGNAINTLKLSDFKYEGVSSDYCDELYIPIENVIQSGKTRVTEYSSARVEGGRETDGNLVFATSKPINRIISVKVYGQIYYNRTGETDKRYLKLVDITDKVIEKSEYDSKSPQDRSFSNSDTIDNFSVFNLYFERGKRNIQHIGDSTYFSWALGSSGYYSKVNLAMAAKICQLGGSQRCVDVRPNLYKLDYHVGDVMCQIEYEALDETTACIGKETTIKNQRNRIFDGQASSIVDLKRQIEQEYSKVNRLGNQQLIIYGNYDTESEIPELGDTIGEYVLYSKEVQYYDGSLSFTGRLCKNYVLQNYFTGVLNEKRIFQLVQNEKATTRHDNIKLYIVACFEEDLSLYNPEETPNFYISEDMSKLISRTLEGWSTNLPKYTFNHCFIGTLATARQGGAVEVDANYTVLGRSMIIDFGFYDNIIAGYGMSDVDQVLTSYPINYVDEDGEASYFDISLYNYYDAGDGEFSMATYISNLETVVEADDFDLDKYWIVVDKAREKPLVSYDGISTENNRAGVGFSLSPWFKDNRERMKFSLQFELTSGNSKIFVKDLFMQTFRFYTTEYKTYKIYVSNNEQYKLNDNIAKGAEQTEATISFNDFDSDYDYFEINGVTLNKNGSWCIADQNGNVVIAVNGSDNRVYFQTKIIKDDRVFNNIIDREVIGKTNKDAQYLREHYENAPAHVQQIKVIRRTINISDTLDVDAESNRLN